MIAITRLLALDGPNLLGPQPSVLLELAADHDQRQAVVLRLKEAAQRVGLVLAALQAFTLPAVSGYLIEVRFTTPTPALGAAVARYVVESLRAKLAGDTEWDDDQHLFELLQRRRADALPLASLQLIAEANSRVIPCFRRGDGSLQLGYGVRGMTMPVARAPNLDVLPVDTIGIRTAVLLPSAPPTPDWSQLGRIPLLSLSGPDICCQETIESWCRLSSDARIAASRWPASACMLQNADFDQVRTVLEDSACTALMLGLQAQSVAERGLPFDACDACAILGLPDIQGDAEQRAQIAGLPLLITHPDGVAALNADIPELAMLADYAACRVIWYSQHEDRVARSIRPGDAGIVLRGQQLWVLADGQDCALADLLPDLSVAGQLAAWALVWGIQAW